MKLKASFLSVFRITSYFVFLAVAPASAADISKEKLGELLFFDSSLSKNRTQSCSSCHSPELGFVDPRSNASGRAVSLGDDGKSLGDRNTPTASYAVYTPRFHQGEKGVYKGGMFLDGRRAHLQEQAGDPLLNPIEMGMPDKESVIERVKENAVYLESFAALFGAAIFEDSEKAYEALTESLAAFEKTDEFAPFDSKYDRYLRGEVELTEQEDLGMTLFFSSQFTNCNLCHQLKKTPGRKGETFSNYEYHNIGVPINQKVRELNKVSAGFRDTGLLSNPQVTSTVEAGKFKVPTLRNTAVTGPYMHNGVFRDLRTVVLFYNKYNSRSAKRQINPESGGQWQAAEVVENLSSKELETGPALDDRKIDALVAFMETLTDKRYEHLLDQ